MKDLSAEDKILAVADSLFTKNGYAATSIRDIAREAEVNSALINYYYKSKENLFSIVMRRKAGLLFGSLLPVFQNPDIPLEEKIGRASEILGEMLQNDRNLPMFVFGELQKQDVSLAEVVPARQIRESSFAGQLAVRQPDVNPLHYILNLFVLAVGPYIVLPLWTKVNLISDNEVKALLAERTLLVTRWMTQMLDNETHVCTTC